MNRLKENCYLLKTFPSFNKFQQKAIQKNLDKNQIKFIIELLGNIGCGNLDVDEKTKTKLRRYRKKINFLLSKKPISRKKTILVNGSFLPVVLKTLASTLIPMAIEKIIENV